MMWHVSFAAGGVAGAACAVLGLMTRAGWGLTDSGLVVAALVAAYAAGLVTVAALSRPAAALIDWRTRLDRDRWRRWCEEEHAARRKAERRLDKLRALGGYRGIGSVGRSPEVPRG